jgi:hypothetical protein
MAASNNPSQRSQPSSGSIATELPNRAREAICRDKRTAPTRLTWLKVLILLEDLRRRTFYVRDTDELVPVSFQQVVLPRGSWFSMQFLKP